MYQRTYRILAAVLLNGPWKPDAALNRLTAALGKSGCGKKWPVKLVTAVFEKLNSNRSPGSQQLRLFLQSDIVEEEVFDLDPERINDWASAFSLIDLPQEKMQPRYLAAMN